MNNASNSSKPIILASSSRYRHHLLGKLGLPFEAASPSVNESVLPGEPPEALCRRLAVEKAQALAERYPAHLIIGSDQVAMLGSIQLTKPGDYGKTVEQLRAVSGKAVEFYTSVCILESDSKKVLVDMDRTVAHFRRLTDRQIEVYVEKDRPFDCAGGFKSEGFGIVLLEKLETSDPNALVGLPLIKLTRLLENFGVELLGKD